VRGARAFGVSGLGIWKKNGDGSPMFDMGRKYLVPVGYNDELKKSIHDDSYNNINDGLIFSSLL
jgi:hypothetical protein